jgi:hypothetical protein
MKGIIKYNQKLYRKAKRPTLKVKEGDLIKLECKRKSQYFKYNGIYTVGKYREIIVENYNGEGMRLGIKLGYNVFYDDFSILILADRKTKSLPMPAKEETLCGYTI